MDSLFDPRGLERFRRRHRVDPHALRRFANAWFKHSADPGEASARLGGPALAAAALAELRFHELELEERHDSRDDGASRLIFRTREGRRLESVILRIRSGRTSLCVSSQIGCAAGCVFCATGMMGLRANLRAAEIADQVVHANRILRDEGRRVRNIVFMGMGEPLMNEGAVFEAIDRLIDARGFAHPPSRILVSTVGVPDAMVRLARRFPAVRLALSLHAATGEVRRRMVPLEARHPLAEIRAALEEIHSLQGGRPVMLETVLLDGVNDRARDADAIVDFARGLRVHVNVIPFNPIDGARLEGSPPERCRWFADRLRAFGLTVTVRYSLGGDVSAACGQLVRRDERRRGVPDPCGG